LSFTEFSLSPELTRSIKDRGHHQATPIQTGAIPVAMSGRDLIATAETGSGKTAAYLIPLIHKLQGQQTRSPRGHQPADVEAHTNGALAHHNGANAHPAGVRAMVLVPTRELAAQVAKEFGILARHTRLRAALIVGGDSMRRQLQDLHSGASVLVARGGLTITSNAER
jgi:ATP-dependent RNA helicase RhlE